MTSGDTLVVDETSKTADPREPLASLFRDLRTSASGLSGREAQRRIELITADVEVIPIQKVNEAYERLLKSDVKYRFSIDMASLK